LRIAALLLLASCAPAREAAAQLLRPRLEISPYAGALLPRSLDVLDIDDAPLFGARVGVRLPGGLAVEGQAGYAPLDVRELPRGLAPGGSGGGALRGFDASLLLLEGGLTFALPLPGPVTPFLGIGGGAARFDPDLTVEERAVESESEVVVSAGAGLRLSLAGLRLRVDLRDHVILDALQDTARALGVEDGGDTLHSIEASLGIIFLF
jgi:hypothetical protein